MKMNLKTLLITGLFCTVSMNISAQNEGENGFTYKLTPYLWGMTTDGDVRVGNVTVPVDMNLSEAVDRLDSAGMLSFEVNKNKWLLFLDASYVNIEDGAMTPVGRVNVEVDSVIMQAAVGYRVVEKSTLSVDVGLGARYFYTDVSINTPEGLPNASRSKDWMDPIIMARLIMDFTEKIYGVLVADVGGFGVSSDVTAQVYGLLGYSFNDTVSLLAGYRYVYAEYENSNFSYDVATSGFMLGLQFAF